MPDQRGTGVDNWNQVVELHVPGAYRAAWRILGHTEDTEDVLQDVLIEAYRHFQSGNVSNWSAFLKRLAICRAIDRVRRRKNSVCTDDLAIYDSHAGPVEQAVMREAEERVRAIIADLPERQAAVFCLFYFESFSHRQIADALEISINSVTVALYKSRGRFRVELSETLQERK